MGVRFGGQPLTGVAPGALAVIEASGQWFPEDIAVPLCMRIMTIDTSHRAVQETIAELVIGLVTEPANAAVGQERIVGEHAEFE